MRNIISKLKIYLQNHLSGILKAVTKIFLTSVIIVLFIGIYVVGLFQGYLLGVRYERENNISYFNGQEVKSTPTPTIITITPTLAVKPKLTPKTQVATRITWGGPELWEAVNKKRVELGVNPLSKRDELCTIASIRLNELLELGKLDGHEGFSNMQDRRPDLKWIFEKYGTLAEFLAVGGKTPEETINLWLNTLGHQKLLNGGEYVWGCIYAQDTFAVAITAY